RAPRGALLTSSVSTRLLDLALDELDVLLRDRIVLLHLQLLGHRARVLLGDVIEPGVGAGDELDLGGDGLGHGEPRRLIGWPQTKARRVKVKKSGPGAAFRDPYSRSRTRLPWCA